VHAARVQDSLNADTHARTPTWMAMIPPAVSM
jgi:hypothetical protein